MREIKFRAWDKENKTMFDVVGINWEFESVTLKTKEGFYIGVKFDEVELMQYTGCKDMDGKEIYEGDILEFEWIEDSCWGPEGTYRGYVRHDDGGYEVVYINRQEYTKGKRGGKHPNSQADELQSFIRYTEGVNVKILGNVYENPELLEVIK